MLIKINESDPQFVEFIEELKGFTNEVTASGAAKQAITKYVMFRKLYERERKIRERLEDNLAEIKDIRRQQKTLEQALSIMID